MGDAFRTDAWERFARHAAYVRANPRFEVEERERKQAIASEVAGLVRAAREGQPALDQVDAVLATLTDPRGAVQLTHRNQNAWLREWSAADAATFAQALAQFAEPEADPEERLERFVETAEAARQKGTITDEPGTMMTLGSLFNFALSPSDLPVVRARPYLELQSRLGQEQPRGGSILDHYRTYVSFARTLAGELAAAGVPVVDMLDVQALIFLSEREEFWTTPAAAYERLRADPCRAVSAPATGSPPPYLSVCACLGFDAPYLIEWLEFHRLVGAERFFLYNNGDREAQRELLAPYVEDGLVVLHDWPVFPPQVPAFQHCIDEHHADSRWIAFIDTDEFLFCPSMEPLPDVLTGYEGCPGVAVNWTTFGFSGHRSKPPGLVIENYLMRLNTHRDRLIKNIVDPSRAETCVLAHEFLYQDGVTVDENRFPVIGSTSTYISDSRFRLNHYFTKSEEEWRAKISRRRPDIGEFREEESIERTIGFEGSATRDETILPYVPLLRPRVEQATQASSRCL